MNRSWKRLISLLLVFVLVMGTLPVQAFANGDPEHYEEPDPTATPEPDPTATPEPDPTATPEPEPTPTLEPTVDAIVLKRGSGDPLTVRINGTFPQDNGLYAREFYEGEIAWMQENLEKRLNEKVSGFNGLRLLNRDDAVTVLTQEGMKFTLEGKDLPYENADLLFAVLGANAQVSPVSFQRIVRPDQSVYYEFTANQFGALIIAYHTGEPLVEVTPEPTKEPVDETVTDLTVQLIPAETAETINRTKASGGRVICVGTTSCRTVESWAAEDGTLKESAGWTNIFIYPGYRFKVLDGLITNFHLPESTLIMLVSALAGREHVMAAYQEAVKERYRFFSFGDAMLIL